MEWHSETSTSDRSKRTLGIRALLAPGVSLLRSSEGHVIATLQIDDQAHILCVEPDGGGVSRIISCPAKEQSLHIEHAKSSWG